MAYAQQPPYNPAFQPSGPPPPAPQYGARGTGGAYGYPPQDPPYSAGRGYPDVEAGYGKPGGAPQRPFEAQHHPNLRNAFLRKIYGTLCLQFAVTAFIGGVCAFHRPAQLAIMSNPQVYLYGSMFPAMAVMMALSCFFLHSHPLNAILLGVFTVLESIALGVICTMYQAAGLGDIIITAAGMTAAIFIGLTVYVHTTRTDFSFLSGFLMAGMWIMVLWGLLNMFLGWHASFLYSACGALLFTGMILFDTSRILLQFGYDDHIAACITLYLDVINLFLYLLQLLASNRNNDR